MELDVSLMDLVSPTASMNQVTKTMHPQGTSAPVSQQSHIPQSLSNMHANTNAAHNYSGQHSYSLNITSSSTTYSNQNQDQTSAAPKNHPTSAVGQAFIAQKSINISSHSVTVVTSPSNVATSKVEEQSSLPEKSHTNGTSETERTPTTIPPPSGNSVTKSPATQTTPESPENEEVDEESDEEAESESPVQTAQVKSDAPTNAVQTTSNSKTSNESSKKVVEHQTAESTISPLKKERPVESSTPETEKKQEVESKPVSKQAPKSEPPPEQSPKQEESKTEKDSNKNSISPASETSKPSPEQTKSERAAQKDTTPKVTPRKTKLPSAQINDGKSSGPSSSFSSTTKRQRLRTQHYQAPLPEVEFVSKLSSTTPRSGDEKLIVFYKNEFLAVRNTESGFYLCQATHNIYKSSPKIKIRWLSQVGTDDQGEIYAPDFYDLIDFDCILTNLSLSKSQKAKFLLPTSEKTRTESILARSLAVEKGEEIASPSLTEEHPDGLDLSLYRAEDQLKTGKGRKRPHRSPAASKSPKKTPTKKSPHVSKVRKVVASTSTASTSKRVGRRVPASKVASRKVTPVEPKPSTSNAKISKTNSKVGSKSATKTNPVVDHKKAKVLARIGRKAAVSGPITKHNSKNGKSGNKMTVSKTGSSSGASGAKASSSAKVAPTRNVRKSARK